MPLRFILLTAGVILLSSGARSQTKRIEFIAAESYPEGVAFDAKRNVFYVSSARKATIGQVDAGGNYSAILIDSSLKSTFGMKVKGDQLWVCAGDPNHSKYRDSATYKKMIRLIGIDLLTGKKSADIDLSALYTGNHFANDLTFDDKGNIYITDSYSPVVYKVDHAGKATVFAESTWFSSAGVGLNGIVWHPGGYLLVTNNGNGNLLKIDISEPARISKVRINQFFPGSDGLLLDDEKNLILVQNKGVNKIFKLGSMDNWQTAKVLSATQSKDMFSYPSTATIRNKETWIMNAKLHELSDSTTVPSKKFSLQLAEFIPVK